MEHKQKRKRSVSASLYSAVDDKKQEVIDAIRSKPKLSTSKLVSKIRPKLMMCFDQCEALFYILDKNHDHSITQKEWLKFSLGSDYYRIAIQAQKRNKNKIKFPRRKPLYANPFAGLKKTNKKIKHSQSTMINRKSKQVWDEESAAPVPAIIGKSMIPKTSRKSSMDKKRLERKSSKAYPLTFTQALIMRQVMTQEFKMVDLNNNGEIDQFEWWVFYMTHDLNIHWSTQETHYRMGIYSRILKSIGPITKQDCTKSSKLTTEWLERQLLKKKCKPKLYLLFKFFYDYFGGEIKYASLLGNKTVSTLEVLSWFIALDYDPFKVIIEHSPVVTSKMTSNKMSHANSIKGKSRPTTPGIIETKPKKIREIPLELPRKTMTHSKSGYL